MPLRWNAAEITIRTLEIFYPKTPEYRYKGSYKFRPFSDCLTLILWTLLDSAVNVTVAPVNVTSTGSLEKYPTERLWFRITTLNQRDMRVHPTPLCANCDVYELLNDLISMFGYWPTREPIAPMKFSRLQPSLTEEIPCFASMKQMSLVMLLRGCCGSAQRLTFWLKNPLRR